MAVNGILGIKLGMAQVFTDDGMAVGCTVLQAGPCVVVQRRTKQKDGYDAAQLGLVEFIKPQRVTKPMMGHFKKSDAAPMRRLGEVRIDDSADETKAGDRVLVDRFQPGEFVDVTGISKGKGFAGGVKRWHFRRRRRHARLDAPSRSGRHWREFVSVARMARPAFSGAHGQSPGDREESARRESGHGRESASGERLGAGSGGDLHPDPEGRGSRSSQAKDATTMAVVDIKNLEGKNVGQMELPDAVFGAKVNPNLLHETVRWYLAAQRAGTHKTKGRGEVSGSGRKLWKQKGTGRARVWARFAARSGARAARCTGRQPRSYAYRLPRKMVAGRAALGAFGKACGSEVDRGGRVAARFAQDQAVPPGARPFGRGDEDGSAG